MKFADNLENDEGLKRKSLKMAHALAAQTIVNRGEWL